jgi:hypothetical protein
LKPQNGLGTIPENWQSFEPTSETHTCARFQIEYPDSQFEMALKPLPVIEKESRQTNRRHSLTPSKRGLFNNDFAEEFLPTNDLQSGHCRSDSDPFGQELFRGSETVHGCIAFIPHSPQLVRSKYFPGFPDFYV